MAGGREASGGGTNRNGPIARFKDFYDLLRYQLENLRDHRLEYLADFLPEFSPSVRKRHF